MSHVDLSAPVDPPSPVDQPGSKPAPQRALAPPVRAGRRTVFGLHRITVGALAVGLVVAVLTMSLLQHTVDQTEDHALAERGREASLVLESLVGSYREPMTTGASVLRVTGANPAAFKVLARGVVGPGQTAVAAAVLEIPARGPLVSPPNVIARVGVPLALSSSPGTTISPLNDDLTLTVVGSGTGRRLGIALGPPAMPGGTALYVEAPLPLVRPSNASAGAFSDLRYATYLGELQRPSQRLFGTALAPITGDHDEHIVAAGNSKLLLAITARGHLTGSLTAALPWIMFAVVLAGTALGAAAVETISRRRDEAVRFGSELSERSAELVTAQAELAVMNASLEHEVEQRTSELRGANRELEAFAYAVSHDLRAPLRAIDGFSLALMEDQGERLDDAGLDYLRRVRAATTRMSALIDDLLALSRVTRSEMQRQLVDMSSLAREILAHLVELHPQRVVETVVPDGLYAQGDPRLLRVALENLFANAWKFSEPVEHARIEFGKTNDVGTTTYFVRDNGVGFDSDHAEDLFAPFKRLHSADEFEGNGIGLATVARVVERHGGHLWARSQVGNGATFFFTCGGPGGAAR